MKTLLLIDGSSYLYRAFHALPDLRNARHEPTGALYGVLNMLRRLHQDYKADYSACVFDAKGKTFRDAWYPEYKANRPPMPDDLSAQIEPLHRAIQAMGWPLIMVEGVEADDVIGTLAQQAQTQGLRTIISTGDKDLAQLVNERVSLVNTMSNESLDTQGVKTKFGVPPERFLDYLTLVGDSVDNVPGVEKVGPKTAVKFLEEYQTLDNLVAHAQDIPGKVGENLRKALDWLPTAKKLLAIKTDVDLPLKLSDLTLKQPDNAKLKELFSRYGFKSWLREASGAAPEGSAPAQEAGVYNNEPPESMTAEVRSAAQLGQYETLLTEEQLDKWLARLSKSALVCLDTETTSLDPLQANLVGLSFAIEPHVAAYLPLGHHYTGAPIQLDLEHAVEKIKPLLENASLPKVGQNIKYDKHVLANYGVGLKGIAHDTLLQSYVLESHKTHDMDSLALRHLGLKTIPYDEVAGKGVKQIGFDQLEVDTATRYSAEDADVTLQLHQALSPQIESQDKLHFIYQNIEMPLLDVLFTMERNGVLLDTRLLSVLSQEFGRKMQDLEKAVHRLAEQPFNLNSPKQIQEILFERLKLPVRKKTPSGAPSTDEDVLQQLAMDYPLPKLLLEYRGLSKLKSTYTDKLPDMINPGTGRVHTSYSQATAVTGRLASSDPNLQNIPIRSDEGRRIREAFIAPKGSVIVSADYSQIELRIMAHLSDDPALLDAFARGQDVHRATAAEIFGCDLDSVTDEQRRYAKVINFGLIYGMSAFGLAGQLGIERGAAQAYMERYFTRYPGVADYMKRTRETARALGYVETVFGRRLWLPEIGAGNAMRRQAAERAAINAPMQGTAADLIKLAMIAVAHWLDYEKMRSLLIMQVHDELVLEVPQAELEIVRARLPQLMCDVAKLKVPLIADVGVGSNWDEAH
jgi:DNA polymerase-1